MAPKQSSGPVSPDVEYGQCLSRRFLAGLTHEQSETGAEMRRLGDEIARELQRGLGESGA